MVTREFRRSRFFNNTHEVNIRDLERRHFKLLVLSIESAGRLTKRDIFGLSDPYVRVRFKGQGQNNFIPLVPNTTKTCKRTLTPAWNETMYFFIGVDNFSLVFDVYDENILTKDDHLGRAIGHFDLTGNPDLPANVIGPNVWDTSGWNVHRMEPYSFRLKTKFSQDLIRDMDSLHHSYIHSLSREINAKRSQPQKGVSGSLKIGYSFLIPSLPETVAILRTLNDVEVTGDSHQDYDRSTSSDSSEQQPGPSSPLGFEGLQLNDGGTTQPASTGQGGTDEDQHPPEGWEMVPNSATSIRTTAYGLEAHDDSSDEDEDQLPEGWEERVDSNGRRVFLNHLTRMTLLRRPNTRQPVEQTQQPTHRNYLPRMDSHDVAEVSDEEFEEVEQVPSHGSGHSLDSLSSTNTPTAPVVMPTLESVQEGNVQRGSAASDSTPTSTGATPTSTGATPLSTATPKLTPLEAKRARLREGLPPGWDVALTQDGKTYYVDHKNKKTAWDRPKMKERKPLQEERGGNTAPVEQDSDLPPGWEMRKTKEGQVYYVNHNDRVTQWEKPGLEQEDLGPLPPGWDMKQTADGKIFFLDHKTKSTQWEDPRLQANNKPVHKMEYSRDYKQKYANFLQMIRSNAMVDSQRFVITVSRNNVMEGSFNPITKATPRELKKRFWVNFSGEQGIDYGGLAREWFQLISHEMFNPYYGLFEYSASDDYTLQINPESGTYNANHLEYFLFIGRVCGMAIYHQKLIDAFFIRPFYKLILGRPITLKDMESVDVELYNSVKYIEDNDPEPLCLTFSVNKTVFGEVIEEELKPGGKDIPVTEQNKKEYINLLINWRFTKRVQRQIAAFRNGLSDLIPLDKLLVFDANELEYLLGGLAHIDVSDWKKNTELRGYQPNDQVIIWFWKAIENYDDEMRARLLQFVTGTSKVPMNGFAELQGSSGPQKFCIKKLGSAQEFPRAHTCFNRIDLPPYPSYHHLKEKLRFAIESTEGYAGVD